MGRHNKQNLFNQTFKKIANQTVQDRQLDQTDKRKCFGNSCQSKFIRLTITLVIIDIPPPEFMSFINHAF